MQAFLSRTLDPDAINQMYTYFHCGLDSVYGTHGGDVAYLGTDSKTNPKWSVVRFTEEAEDDWTVYHDDISDLVNIITWGDSHPNDIYVSGDENISIQEYEEFRSSNLIPVSNYRVVYLYEIQFDDQGSRVESPLDRSILTAGVVYTNYENIANHFGIDLEDADALKKKADEVIDTIISDMNVCRNRMGVIVTAYDVIRDSMTGDEYLDMIDSSGPLSCCEAWDAEFEVFDSYDPDTNYAEYESLTASDLVYYNRKTVGVYRNQESHRYTYYYE